MEVEEADFIKKLEAAAAEREEQKKIQKQLQKENSSRKNKEQERKPGKKEQSGKNVDRKEGMIPYTLASQMIPIRKINNGIVHTTDGRYIKIIEIRPVNFLLRSNQEQRYVIQAFFSYLKVAPCRFQIRTMAQKADVGRYISRVREEMAQEENEMCRKLQEDYIGLLQDVGLKEAVSRRFFMIFEYDPSEGEKNAQEADIQAALEGVADTAKQYLGRCGNEVVLPERPTQFTMELLYRLLNRKNGIRVPFTERINDVAAWYIKENGKESVPQIPVTEYFAPRELDLTHPNFLVMNGLYYTFLYIPSGKYKTRTPAGWTALLVNAGEGIDVDFYFFKQDKGKSLERIGRRIRLNRSKIQDLSDTQSGFDDLADSIQSGLYLKRGLAGNEELYYMCTLVTITAYSEKELMWRTKEMKKLLNSQDMDGIPCYFRQEQAFLSTLPILALDDILYEKTHRNILTWGAAGCYPFVSHEMSDDDGILLGINKSNRSLVIMNIFDSRLYSNANITIWGTSGAGKTFLLQLLALRMRRKGIQVFLIVPDKGHEFVRACKNIGGQYSRISPSSPDCINVMEIWKEDRKASDILDGEMEKSYLAAKIQDLHIFFSLLVPDMSYEEKQLLDEAMVRTYKLKGITFDNSSLFEKEGDDTYKTMPILGDLYGILLERQETKRLAGILNRLVNGSGGRFNQQTNVHTDNKYNLLDISELSGDLQAAGMFITFLYVWAKAREDRTKPKVIILDELWKLIGAGANELAAAYVLEMFKVIRGYGGSAIAASQDSADFFALEGGKYGRGIINNSKTKIIMNMENEEAAKVQDILKLSDAETSAITHFERGNGLLSSNGVNVAVEIRASQLEKELITTDRKELEELRVRLEREGKTGKNMLA